MRSAVRADISRAIAMSTAGAIAFAAVEYVVTLSAYAGSSAFASKLRLCALTATLSLVLWLLLTAVLIITLLAARIVRAQIDPETERAPGWFALGSLEGGARPIAGRGYIGGFRAGVPQLWAALATATIAGGIIQRGSAWAIATFKEPQLTAGVIAAASISVMVICVVVHRVARIAATGAARALAPVLGVFNPLGRWRAAGVAMIGLVAGALVACWFALPQSRSVLPLRMIASGGVIALGMGIGAQVHAGERSLVERGPLLDVIVLVVIGVVWIVLPGATWALVARGVLGGVALVVAPRLGGAVWPRPLRTKKRGLAWAGGTLALTTLTFAWWGADLEAKYVAITASPALEHLIGVVRFANDLDRDGYGTVLGEADCAPFDKSINRGATDIPDDGIDQNCDGRDFSLKDLAAASGPTATVPPAFQRPWNVLLITIDTVRYDRTTFGGYAASEKHRDTTPNLQQLVNHSTSFTFTNAPSAGTMASIPAIIMSKYFHSGIALGDAPPGVPPKILPENTTLPEIMKRNNYVTGVIGSHEWWNDWGLDQGVDEYDNSIGKKPDPFIVAADKVTDHALAYVTRHQKDKWFLWAHYIDPHGRYVAHPQVADWGNAETDLYDSEIKWTDQELGRLLDEMKRLPSNDNTLIIITSDHGDSMAEHGIPLGTHGTALYRELLHVPMIFYIPNNPPHLIGGAVSNLDIVPTIAQLCAIDTHDLSFEGRSLVGELFTGKADPDRIVFSETNAPNRQRAAISERWKLIYRLASNVEELYDLKADPWEHNNLAPKNPPELAMMKRALQGWLDRVLYARDPLFNQQFRQMKDVLATEPPPVATKDQTIADGSIRITGIGAPPGVTYKPGGKADVLVYFQTTAATTLNYRFELMAWPATDPAGPIGISAAHSNLRATADGGYSTNRWKVGEQVRDRFELTFPAEWKGQQIVIGLISSDTTGARSNATGLSPQGDRSVAILGTLPFDGPPDAPLPPPTTPPDGGSPPAKSP
ncbi:MAG TPA: sulfatase-like hydrolase/transferase [Kofleriaceae bacterium]